MNDKPLYNSGLIAPYIEYLRKYYSDVDIDSILSDAGMTHYEIGDKGHWFTQREVDLFYETLTKKTKNPNICRDVGRYTASSQTSGALRQYALGFIGPGSAYTMMEKNASNVSRAHVFKTKQIAKDKVEITVTLAPGVEEKPYQCENRIGLFESIAKLFINKFAKVEHPDCLHNGAQEGRYIITWEKTPSLLWKRVRNYSLLLGILFLLTFYFVLPVTPWAIIASLFALFTLIFSFYTAHLEKKDLLKTVETQGDVAKDLLDEMNIRYNNALLIQEIGQATSTIVNIDKLINIVVSVIEKHLDFDRGMIMLANNEKTRLIYSGGYGYNKEQEKLLQGTEFHLDKLESKGMFVSAFKKQEALLLNAVSENGKNFSKRTLELAEQMGVKSLICVPIIYEKKSLGILAVDNVKSKRLLTQSDMSLLMGVGSQTAISIINAVSFHRLQQSEKKYRDLVENANSIILRRDIKGNITFFNEFAQKFFGYGEDEIMGRNILGTILPDTVSTKCDIESLSKVLHKDPERHMVSEDESILSSGKSVWIAWTYKPIFDGSKQLKEILCIGNDITELKRSDKEKKTLEAQLQGAQKMEAIGTLAGGIAHDFNNILQAIIGYTQIMLMGKDLSDPDHEKLEAIESSAQRASELTKRLLIFGRKVESKLRPVDLNQEVVQVSKMLERTIPKMISIELNFSENLQVINGDPVQIEQIMMNMGVNARDAMPDGGRLFFETKNVTLDVKFCKNHLGASPGEYVLLKVSDTGHGMDKELQEHIFEPFFTTKQIGKGTGLGLAMVYGIVKSHGGYITCMSEPGEGTAFSIYFPIIESEIDSRVSKEAEAPIKGGTETILLVDDEESIRQLGEELLGSFGYTVLTAPDGESALELYEKENEQVDLVILDLSMPGMGGKRCLEKLVEMNPRVKVIIASGYSVNGPTKDAVDAGAKGFVGKPYEIRQMLQAIREVMDNKK
ncbi:MAG: response regulator [Desulfobacterales bacterium]|nr:response regulator [Desulfobacterales bacterium]